MNEKVIITCKEHGDFLQSPNGHLNGHGCYKCGYDMFIFSNNDFAVDKIISLRDTITLISVTYE